MKLILSPLIILMVADFAAANPVRFSAMGCGPYRKPDEVALRHHIAQENREQEKSAFIVHLGDINSGALAKSGKLFEERYAAVASWLADGSEIPTYIVPGDNEWNDRPDPDVGWGFWSKHLMRLNEKFEMPWKTQRQEVRPENFAFVHDGVLFIGLNVVGGRVHDPVEWATRFKQDNDWVEAQFSKHGAQVRAAVVMLQANVVGQGKPKVAVNLLFKPFTSRFAELAAGFDKPVLLIHADGHKWTRDHPWKGAPKVTRVQVDLIQAKFPPLQVTVREKPGEDGQLFEFDRRLDAAEWRSKK
ncbi:MAG: hypothetical protein ACR2RV_27455 [Verrucomicrobiales bacterium]